MIEEQLGLGVADNLRHLQRELAIGDSQGVGRDVHVRILSWLPEAWISHMSLRQMPRATPEGCRRALLVLLPGSRADCLDPKRHRIRVPLRAVEREPHRPSSLLRATI